MRLASWCDYYGIEKGHCCGVAILDNPVNIGYPSYWHSRNYGLMAPNNFFKGGPIVIKEGEAITYKYRVVVHSGDTAAADITARFNDYANPPAVTAEE